MINEADRATMDEQAPSAKEMTCFDAMVYQHLNEINETTRDNGDANQVQ